MWNVYLAKGWLLLRVQHWPQATYSNYGYNPPIGDSGDRVRVQTYLSLFFI